MNRVDKSMTSYIHLSKYSRFLEEKKRRETWEETVQRSEDFWCKKFPEYAEEIEELFDAELSLEAVGSMRTLMTAGEALERDNAAGFNCAGIAVNDQRVLDEIFYLLMCGSGVGFSVERQYTNQLPIVPVLYDTDTCIEVHDSKIGWAKALKQLIGMLYIGEIPLWDTSPVRPAGARLKTFGGRASGPEPLDNLFRYVVKVFLKAQGRRLNSLELHDLICKIADTVIVGSVRRSACISLSNLSDNRMAGAKNGEWYLQNPHRALANNSVAYTEKPDLEAYTREMSNLYSSKAGERGIINKVALKNKAESCGREHDGDYVLNPCGEAILRDTGGLCNLSEVICRATDTLEDLKRKVRFATIHGTLQSTLSNFRYLRDIWKKNQEEERLLGVSLTGIMDHKVLSNRWGKWEDEYGNPEMEKFLRDIRLCGCTLENVLEMLKQVAIDTNKEWAKKLGIEPSKHICLIKPSGTVSQLCGTSSGIHPRFAPYYLRRVTQDIKDPLTDYMIEQGIPYVSRDSKIIFSFPIKSPEGSVCARDMGAMEQLELWKIYREYWCDGNPSQTIYYTDDDFLDVQAWVYRNWDIIGGLSFFPLDDYVYDKEAQPYLEITKEEYEKALAAFPEVAWESFQEDEDCTTGSQELACAGGQCEL